ncbi:MAG TPA: DUF4304 domain-containing protein [Myxococcota bacterium]|nr:DUF4304 domain-containing protein [Myxococcota bacterium]
MVDRVAVEKVVAKLLKPGGYKKSRSTWHRVLPETVLVVNIQGSEWGPSLYMNLGVYLRGLGEETSPPEYRCHLRTRLDRVVEHPSSLAAALELHSDMPISERERIVADALMRGLAWLGSRETEAKARTALLAEKAPAGLVTSIARRHLGIDGAG